VLEMMAAQCSKGRVPECPIIDTPGRNGPLLQSKAIAIDNDLRGLCVTSASRWAKDGNVGNMFRQRLVRFTRLSVRPVTEDHSIDPEE
jgi:hypothetical protein